MKDYKVMLASLLEVGSFLKRESDAEWNRIEGCLGLVFPARYKELADNLWNIRLFGDYRFLHPTDKSNLLERTEILTEIFEMEDCYPIPLHPEPDGFVNVIDTGMSLYVLIRYSESGETEWAIVDTDLLPSCFRIVMEPWEFIYKLMSRTLDDPHADTFLRGGEALGLDTLASVEG